ncbi:glycoside hydrolase family 130 protein [Sphingomonas sp. NPDC079357]|uniref:glycoside hydrolase family 130 protein n=1 Tax=Sphingomonas sp. NPDC079357 TaxID=3364518 RepID=UPI00384F0F85
MLERILALPPADVSRCLASMRRGLDDRHGDIVATLRQRFEEVSAGRALPPVSADQALLIAAYFSEEYAFEAAALFSPSMTVHPDQEGVGDGSLRFALSMRGVGDGHVSSITFRSGLLDAAGQIVMDPPSPQASTPRIIQTAGADPSRTAVRLAFNRPDDLSAVVIFPVTFEQRHGLEDLRLVRFVDDDASVRYVGTYTAFSGEGIRQELLHTLDFQSFDLLPLAGDASATKGMALFPRRIDGRFVMLGRQDHESLSLLYSDDLQHWDTGIAIMRPRYDWELVQLGNCGSPIELEEGWLVVTHGVGMVRTYAIGACLLDLHDPSRILARMTEPLIVAGPAQRDGYVPNVVYSCGAIIHEGKLIVPFGVADSFVMFGTVPVSEVLGAMTPCR